MIILLSLFLAIEPSRAESIKIKFDDVAPMVLERNQHVKGANLQKRSAEAARGHLTRSFLPRVGVRAGSESYTTGSQPNRSDPFGSVEARVNIYRSGRDRIESEIVETRARSVGFETDQAVRDEVRKSREAFWNLISLRELVKMINEAKEENLRNQKAAQGRIRAGIATATDRIEFEMHQVALDQDLARAQLEAENTERELAILLGLNENANIDTDVVVGHEHSDQIVESELDPAGHPAVASLSSRARESALEQSRLGRWWAPSVDMYAGYSLYPYREREYIPQSERLESLVGIQLTFELFDGLAARTEATQKALLSEGLKFEYQQSARELNADIESSKSELKLTHRLIHQSEDALKKSNSYLSRTLDEYRRGVKNSPDVLAASERHFQMKRRFAELRRDYQIARVRLLGLFGK